MGILVSLCRYAPKLSEDLKTVRPTTSRAFSRREPKNANDEIREFLGEKFLQADWSDLSRLIAQLDPFSGKGRLQEIV